jgi:hypothetical protein
MAAKGQNGGDCEKSETTMGWTCEGRCKGVEKSPRLLGQLLVIPVEDASSLARLLRLLVPEDAELFLGHALAGLTGYTGHGSLLSEMKYVPIPAISPRRLAFRKPQEKGKSRT